ncbi:helix-turn-helix transcriptional regulator [Salimicrobium sp. PL1-032A]|uniref:helix-turn-helix transcriptional regulator n=1 Tax=Salimicrobium sp. PL1-032A TaxID=3095364 RepID=UPI00325FFE10
MDTVEHLYLKHLDENIDIMNDLEPAHFQNEEIQGIYRLLMNRDRDTLYRIFRHSYPTKGHVPDADEWKRIQFLWKSIIVTATLQSNLRRHSPIMMSRLFSLLFSIDDMKPGHFDTGATFLIDKMLSLYAANVKELEHVSSPHVGNAVHLINSKVKQEKLGLKVIADQLGLSSPYLSAIFQKEMKESITAYIHRKKIEASTEQLLYTNHPVQRIAKEYGYSSLTAYDRKFKELMGMTPLQYRKEHSG